MLGIPQADRATMTNWQTRNEMDVAGSGCHRYIARQPILDRVRNTFGYELLFRSSWENRFCGDDELSSQTIIDNTLAYGMESLVGEAAAFINCTHSLLTEQAVSLLPTRSVLELLETIRVDEHLVSTCVRLRKQGYRIALDDFSFDSQWDVLLPLADFIKVDFRASSPKQRKVLIKRLAHQPTLFIAEKIETEEEFQIALKEGFHLFQGYFFARPIVVARPALSSVMQRLRLFAELRKSELDDGRILRLLKEETSIAIRVLRLANSAACGAREQIGDLRTALSMIGHEQFRRLSLAALAADISGSATPELHRRILQSGRFCELMATQLRGEPEEFFLFGVLSVMTPLLKLSPKEIGEMLSLAPGFMQALAGESNSYSELTRSISCFERGQWDHFTHHAQSLRVHEDELAEGCVHAQQWAMQVTSCSALA